MPDLYQDKWITCTDDAIVIRWYYLWGPKNIPYTAIRSAQRVDIRIAHGTGRIWGTVNLQYWASLDPGRWYKAAALILDVGGTVQPFITPDDVPQVAEIIRQRSGLSCIPYTGLGRRLQPSLKFTASCLRIGLRLADDSLRTSAGPLRRRRARRATHSPCRVSRRMTC